MATKTKRLHSKSKRARPERPGHVGEVRILQSSRTRGQDIRVSHPWRRAAR
ncbi:MAG: hypothetical protein PHS14_08770 [Elusimicrobia bacterium]|nr:hypothetical protein [Elusimicrobiota bacterium]